MDLRSRTLPISLLVLSDTHSYVAPPSLSTSKASSVSPSSASYSDTAAASTSIRFPSSPLTRSPFTANPRTLLHPLPISNIHVLLHAGDLTMTGRLAEHLRTYSLISTHPAELKIVIPGNHDVTLDVPYYERIGARRFHIRSQSSGQSISEGKQDTNAIRELWTDQEARKRGVVYMEEGTRTFRLKNGVKFTVYASGWTPEFCNWAFGYERHVDRFNPAEPPAPSDDAKSQTPTVARASSGSEGDAKPGKFSSRLPFGHLFRKSQSATPSPPQPPPAKQHSPQHRALEPIQSNPAPDIVLTHGPPYSIFDGVPDRFSPHSLDHVGCPHLLRALRRSRPRLHVFGHIHEGWGAGKVSWNGNGNGNGNSEAGNGGREPSVGFRFTKIADASISLAERTKPEAMHLDAKGLKVGEETWVVNASMVDESYRGNRRAWVVEMDLPVVEREGEGELEKEKEKEKEEYVEGKGDDDHDLNPVTRGSYS